MLPMVCVLPADEVGITSFPILLLRKSWMSLLLLVADHIAVFATFFIPSAWGIAIAYPAATFLVVSLFSVLFNLRRRSGIRQTTYPARFTALM